MTPGFTASYQFDIPIIRMSMIEPRVKSLISHRRNMIKLRNPWQHRRTMTIKGVI